MEVRKMGPNMRVLEGGWERGRSALEAAYDHYRLELRGNLVSKNTLEHYDYLARPRFDWLDLERPDVTSEMALPKFESSSISLSPSAP
jgi:hypothetical protein